jgi:hypothetical protein
MWVKAPRYNDFLSIIERKLHKKPSQENKMRTINVKPKFDIGDFISLKQDVAAVDTQESFRKYPPRLLIIEIHTITCIAGTQINYGVRGYDKEGRTAIMQYNEVEVQGITPMEVK